MTGFVTLADRTVATAVVVEELRALLAVPEIRAVIVEALREELREQPKEPWLREAARI